MIHPFEGILKPAEAPPTDPTRRALLRRLVGAVAAVFGAGGVASGQVIPRPPTTQALGEEGGVVTTYALGEEGGISTTYALGEEGGITTYAFGEEGGVATTYAFGEEGGANPGPGWATTFAIGEEGGRPRPPRPIPSRRPTTMALGEEGGRR